MRNGYYTNSEGIKVDQVMYYTVEEDKKIPKGIRTVLTERGLWIEGLRFVCDNCKSGNKPIRNELGEVRCCARTRLGSQPDFAEQKEWLRELVEDVYKHQIIFYPKYHCELNYIEMVWGFMKTVCRKNCEYNYKALKELIPKVIKALPIAFIRRAQRHCFRMLSGYKQGLEGPLLDYATRKYRSHRCIPSDMIDVVKQEYKDYCDNKNK